MNTFHHLLAATDLSSSSLHAVDRGFLIAGQAGARYTVVHALELDALTQLRDLLGGDASDLTDRIADRVREALAQVVSDPSRNRGVAADLRIEPGLAASAVRRCADEVDADLVLVGAHGEGFLQRFVLGSTASRLLRTTDVPVLLVKEPCRAPYRRVLVAVDFSPASELAIMLAQRIAAPGADLHLFHALEMPFEGKLKFAGAGEELIRRYRSQAIERASRGLHEMATEAGLSEPGCLRRVRHGEASQSILAEEEERDCDLIVMGKHGTNFAGELLLGSVTSRVLSQSRSDVLVVVDEQRPADGGTDA